MSEKGRILVVDDDVNICEVLKDILELEGYDVDTASSGYEALDRGRENKYEVVLMDIKMDGINGVEAFKEFKKIQPGVPCIMISAYAMEELIQESLREGAFAILSKPLDHKELFEKIEAAKSGGTMILVADDNEDLCDMLTSVLESEGYRALSAYDGQTAVKMARQNNFDIMIIDMKLPVLNGLETYLAIREIRPDTVAIVVSGFPQEMNDLAKKAVQESAYVYLRKPLDINYCKELLSEILEHKKLGDLKKPDPPAG